MNDSKIRVLILGVGGNVSQGIIKALRNSNLDIELIGGCISPRSIGLYMCDRAYLSPYANEDRFVDWLIDICNQEAIDIVLTGVEENICAIQQQIEKFNKNTRAIFAASDYDKLMIGQDKYLTCEWLKVNDCNFPRYCKAEDAEEVEKLVQEVGFPLIAKPRNGKSSNGLYKIENQSQLDRILDYENYIIEECIGNEDQEYTVGCYCDRFGELQDIIIMHRELVDGSTAWAEVVENEMIYEEAVKICKAFGPRGPLNIQMRLDETGVPVCFELNVRFSGTTPMRTHFGYKDVEAMIREYVLKEDIDECFDIQKGEVFRYVNEMYLDSGASVCLERDGVEKDMKSHHMCIEKM